MVAQISAGVNRFLFLGASRRKGIEKRMITGSGML